MINRMDRAYFMIFYLIQATMINFWEGFDPFNL